MVVITGTLMLAENNYATSDIPILNLEYIIDSAMVWLNLMAGQSMGPMTGVTPTMTVTVTANQAAVLKPLISLLMKAFIDRGPNTSVGGISVVSVLSDPQYAVHKQMLSQGIQMLRGRSFERV